MFSCIAFGTAMTLGLVALALALAAAQVRRVDIFQVVGKFGAVSDIVRSTALVALDSARPSSFARAFLRSLAFASPKATITVESLDCCTGLLQRTLAFQCQGFGGLDVFVEPDGLLGCLQATGRVC